MLESHFIASCNGNAIYWTEKERELDHLIVDSASVFGGLWASTQTWRRTITSVHSPYFYCFCLSSLTFLIKNGFDVYLIINLAYVLVKNCNFFPYRESELKKIFLIYCFVIYNFENKSDTFINEYEQRKLGEERKCKSALLMGVTQWISCARLMQSGDFPVGS